MTQPGRVKWLVAINAEQSLQFSVVICRTPGQGAGEQALREALPWAPRPDPG